MQKRFSTLRLLVPAVALVLVAGCETSSVYENRYARYYDACDQEAGRCYTRCLGWEEGSTSRAQCQSDCSATVDRCFGDISDRISRDEALRYAYTPAPFYGRYGYYRPGFGYVYGPHGYPYSYRYRNRGYGYDYGYDRGHDQRRRDRDYDRDYDRDRDHGDRGRDDRGRDDRGRDNPGRGGDMPPRGEAAPPPPPTSTKTPQPDRARRAERRVQDKTRDDKTRDNDRPPDRD